MRRVATIGCGRIAPSHPEELRLLPERVEVVAVCDISEKPSSAVSRRRTEGVDLSGCL